MKMTPEYMADLHSYIANPSGSTKELYERVCTHLKYIPGKKLYRYRPNLEREFNTLQASSIWMTNPNVFSDVFDSIIPIANSQQLGMDYSVRFFLELFYEAYISSAEEGEEILEKESLLEKLHIGMLDVMKRYSPEEAHQMAVGSLGIDDYNKSIGSLPAINLKEKRSQATEVMRRISKHPRENLAIACFTTNWDNRNMWENYAAKYQGFCVEYDFSSFIQKPTLEAAWNILNLLPVSYYKNPPIFDHTHIIRLVAEADIKKQEVEIDMNCYLADYYRALTAKRYDYRAEQEWRLIMGSAQRGEWKFPHVSKIFAGKDMSKEDLARLKKIGEELNTPLYLQTISYEECTFKYVPV